MDKIEFLLFIGAFIVLLLIIKIHILNSRVVSQFNYNPK